MRTAVRRKPKARRDIGTGEIGGSGRRYTAEDRAIIFQGCPVSTLAEIFRMKRQNVERKLVSCPVAGISNQGTPLYHIADAAPFLMRVKLTEKQVYDTLQRADPKDFPPMTNKIFWEGLAQRRKYEEQVGDLWHTSDIATVLGQAFNAVRMSLLLLPDELSDQAGLNEQQRKVVQDTVDATLVNCRDALVDELRKPSRSGPESSSEEGEI
jgi:hypothetical protein